MDTILFHSNVIINICFDFLELLSRPIFPLVTNGLDKNDEIDQVLSNPFIRQQPAIYETQFNLKCNHKSLFKLNLRFCRE